MPPDKNMYVHMYNKKMEEMINCEINLLWCPSGPSGTDSDSGVMAREIVSRTGMHT
jgi:hypothetical protein